MANRPIAAAKALYLYGISKPSGKKPAQLAAAGIDGVHPVRPLACGDYLCWVSEVDGKSFSEAIQSNMENLEWLALHSVRHQQAVGEIFSDRQSSRPGLAQSFPENRPCSKMCRQENAALKKSSPKSQEQKNGE